MNEQELQQVANDAATGLPGVIFEHRENPNWETYKVGGKVFLLMTDLPGHPVVTVKADPDRALALREQYEEITPGYHTDKRHWVSAAAGPGIDESLVRGLVNDSYGLVVDNLPQSARPGSASTSSEQPGDRAGPLRRGRCAISGTQVMSTRTNRLRPPSDGTDHPG